VSQADQHEWSDLGRCADEFHSPWSRPQSYLGHTSKSLYLHRMSDTSLPPSSS
jgi:hypothetical protein